MEQKFLLPAILLILLIVLIVILVTRQNSTTASPSSPPPSPPPSSTSPLLEPGCESLSLSFPKPSSDDLFNMHLQFDTQEGEPTNIVTNWILPRVRDLNLPISSALNDPSYPVYGYAPSGNLVLSGGSRYNSTLSTVDFRIHGLRESDELDITLDNVTSGLTSAIKFFTERGFQIAGPDTRFNEEQTFFNVMNQVRNDGSSVGYVGRIYIKPVYNPSNNQLTHIDFGAFDFIEAPFAGFTDYEPNLDQPTLGDNRDRRFSYPMRIPVSQTCLDYNSRLGSQPAAYYRAETGQLFIDVPEGTDFLMFRNPNFQVAAPDLFTVEISATLNAFSGVFASMRRDNSSQIVLTSSMNEAQYLVQVSETIRIKSTFLSEDFITTDGEGVSDRLYYRSSDKPGFVGAYSGFVLPMKNGGSPAYDIYIINPGVLNGFAQWIDGYQFPEHTHAEITYAIGDNIYTVPVEDFGSQGNFTVFDNEDWSLFFLQFDQNTFTNPPIPELISNAPAPQQVPEADRMIVLNSHEYVHSMHIGQGIINSVATEAIATGLEMLNELNKNIFSTSRPRSWASFLTSFCRGYWGFGGLGSLGNGFATYGSSMLYHHMIKKYDLNAQALRRAGDLLVSVYLSSLADLGVNATLESFFTIYGAAERHAMSQAYNEILSRNFLDDYCDTAVSMALLRNNGSIPSKYRAEYPYWLCSANYPQNNSLDDNFREALTQTSFIQPAVGGTVNINLLNQSFTGGGNIYIRSGSQRYGIYEVVAFNRVDPNLFNVTLELVEVLDSQIPGTIVPASSEAIFSDFTEWWDAYDSNSLFWNRSIENYAGPPLPEFHTIAPVLSFGTFIQDLEDLQCLIYDVAPGPGTITVTANVSTFRVCMVQFNPDGGAGSYQQLPSIGNMTTLNQGDQEVYSTSSLTGSGRKRLVIIHATIKDWSTDLPWGPASNLVTPNFYNVYNGTVTINASSIS